MEITPPEELKSDLSLEEVKALEAFRAKGLPGINRITDVDTFGWLQLYLSGKTYEEIALITKSKKEFIIYISDKSKWFEKKMSYYDDLANNMVNKMAQGKIDGFIAVTGAVAALSQYHNLIFDKFIQTKDTKLIENMDVKLLSMLHKSIDLLDKMGSLSKKDNSETNTPNINFNFGNNQPSVEVKENGESTKPIELGDILKYLVDHKVKEENGET